MNEKYLRKIIREIIRRELDEISTTANVGSYLTPHAVSRSNRDNRATKQAKSIGYSKVKKKKRPYSTKLIDYLNNE